MERLCDYFAVLNGIWDPLRREFVAESIDFADAQRQNLVSVVTALGPLEIRPFGKRIFVVPLQEMDSFIKDFVYPKILKRNDGKDVVIGSKEYWTVNYLRKLLPVVLDLNDTLY